MSIMWLVCFYNLECVQITKPPASMKERLLWEHSPLQDVPSSEREKQLPSFMCRFHEINTEPCPLFPWNSRKLGILTESHFDNKWIGWYSGGASPIFKKHVQGQEWWRVCELLERGTLKAIFVALWLTWCPTNSSVHAVANGLICSFTAGQIFTEYLPCATVLGAGMLRWTQQSPCPF